MKKLASLSPMDSNSADWASLSDSNFYISNKAPCFKARASRFHCYLNLAALAVESNMDGD